MGQDGERTVPIPALLETGLLPPGIHPGSLPDIEVAFGSSNDQRTRLFQGLTKFVPVAKGFGLFKSLVIDGSFVTDKPDPRDIDAVLEMDRTSLGALLIRINRNEVMDRNYVKAFYDIDLYMSPVSPSMVAFFQHLRSSEAIVRKLGPDSSKGLVRIPL